MQESFDIIIIGTGPAASRIAAACASKRSVAVVEAREPGGTCALRGCNPKKVLVRAAELMQWGRNAPYAPENREEHVSWQRLMKFKDEFIQPIPEKTRNSLKKKGIALFEGHARFTGPQRLIAGDKTLHGKQFVIATGARPAPIDVPGAEHLVTSDTFLELQELPSRILFVGGGFVSFEFAHVAARFGAECTIIEQGPAMLNRFEPQLVSKLAAYTQDLGVKLHTNATLRAIEQTDAGPFRVAVGSEDGDWTLEVDCVVHGAGRVPAIEDLGLDAGNIEAGKRGVIVNEYMQSQSNPQVYAAGDAADSGQPMLSPVASQEGRIVAKNLLEGPEHTADYGAVPTVAYTAPGLAAVGTTEADAREGGLQFDIREGDRADWLSMRKVGATCAAYRILVEKESGRILGAHLLGPDAAETINYFAMAMKFDLTAADVKSVLFAFPSFSADVRKML